ncbi:MAG: hypothetical protein Q9168_002169 [Polycauliona sp. 1 TL-2023]
MTQSALLVVDMQEDFCPPHGALSVPGGRGIASPINELLAMPFTLKIATRDWHPADHISFDSNNQPPNNKAFESSVTILNPRESSESMAIPVWPAHCVQGTPGAEIIPEINTSAFCRIIDKGRNNGVEMFSAFRDTFGNKSDAASFDLAAYLHENMVRRVFVVGLAGDYCVRCTAMDAKKEGFDVYVVDEAVRSIHNEEDGWGATKRQFKEAGIEVVVLSLFGPPSPSPLATRSVPSPASTSPQTDPGMKISKEYEKKGGDYENEAGSKNEPAKGAPESKSEEEKKEETKGSDDKKEEKAEKPKANSGRKATGKKADTKAKAPKKEKKAPTEGTRKSTRIGGKRSAPEEEQKEEKAPAKKAKTAKK